GLARELGQDAARVLDGRERAADTALDIGMTVAGAILPGGAAGAGAKGLARAAAIGLDAAGAAKVAQDAADAGLAAEIEKHGLDPTNPDTLRHLPPDARNRIAAKAAIAFAANGGAKAGAARIVRHATKLVGESEVRRAVIESGAAEAIYRGFDGAIRKD
ncbi:hypothetical protein ACFQHZ_10670, partial [Marivibrio halodurans]